MVPSQLGQIVCDAWDLIPRERPWILPVAFALMPNHVHGILSVSHAPADRPTPIWNVVGSFKANATRKARRTQALRQNETMWQRSFDVRFLQSERRLQTAFRYVEENWKREWNNSAAGE